MKTLNKLNKSVGELHETIETAKYFVPMVIEKEYAKIKAEELKTIAGELFVEFPNNSEISRELLKDLEYIINYLENYSQYDLLSFLQIAVDELIADLN